MCARKFSEKKRIFGSSKGFVESATNALEGKTLAFNNNIGKYVNAVKEVGSCEYEYNTAWGKQVSKRENKYSPKQTKSENKI